MIIIRRPLAVLFIVLFSLVIVVAQTQPDNQTSAPIVTARALGRMTTPALWISDENEFLGGALFSEWRGGAVNNKIHAFVVDSFGISFYRMNDAGTNTSPSGFSTPDLLIAPTGNIGINTTSPDEKLEVNNGAILSSGASGGAFIASNPNNQSARVRLDWLNDIPRIRFGGSGVDATNGYVIQGPGDITKL
jgi:hypothetical protein